MNEVIDGAERARARQALRHLIESAAGPRLRTRWRPLTVSGLARATIGVCGFLIAFVGLCLVGVAGIVATGSVNLESLRPTLLAALQERLGPQYRVSLASTYLTHSEHGFGLGLGFGGIEIDDRAGRALLSAPRGRIGLDPLSLLRFDVSVRRLELEGLSLSLRVHADGAISIAAAGSPDAASLTLPPPPAGALAAAGADPGALALAAVEALAGASQPLDHVAIAHGHLNVDNEPLRRSLAYEDVAIAYDRTGSGATIGISARGPSGPWRIAAHATLGAERRLTLQANDLGLHDILMVSAGRPPFETDMPISFTLDASVEPDGALDSADGAFALGAGFFKLDDPDHRKFLIDEASGSLRFDPSSGRFLARRLEMLAGSSHYRFDGAFTPPQGGGPWGLHLDSSDAVYGPERPGEPPVVIDKTVADGRFFPSQGRLSLDRLAFHGPTVQGEMSLEAVPQGDSAALKLDLKIGPSSIVDGLRLWPAFINPPARTWCVDNVRAGAVVAGELTLDWDADTTRAALAKRALPADSVRADFTVSGGAVDLLPGVPRLSGLDGSGHLTGKTFEMHAKSGEMELGGGRRLEASDVYFRVPNTAPAPIVPAEAGAHVFGAADAVVDLLSREALKKYARLTLDPAKVKGQADGQLTIALALGDKARPEDQKFRVEGSLSNFQLDGYFASEKFEQGALDVFADGGTLKMTGQGQFGGAPAKVEVTKTPSEEGQIQLAVTLDNAARARLGIAPGVTLDGPIVAKLKSQFNRAGGDVDVDLTKTEIRGVDGLLLKAAGKPGKAAFAAKTSPDGVALTGLAVDAGLLAAHGSAQLAADGTLQSVKLTQLRFGPSDDLSLEVQGGSTTKVLLRGASLDARGLIKAFLSRDPPGGAVRDLDIDARLDAALGFDDQTISGLDLEISRRDGKLANSSASGRLGRGQIRVTKRGGGELRLDATDGGAAARFLDLYSRIDGGRLELTLNDEPGGSHGVAVLRDFKLLNEPALSRMSAAAPATAGTRHDVSTVGDGGAVHFDRLAADFVRNSGRIDVKEMLVYNVSEGIRTQGYIDFGRDKVDLSGTFVPVYLLNNIVSGIPVVGVLLGGDRHEGVFGVNFRITGPASAPTLTINPLSTVAPGIFRKVFGVIDGTQTQATPTPAPTQ